MKKGPQLDTVELALIRYYGTFGYTAGRLFINGEFECYTLEDEVRQLEDVPVKDWKIKKITAIPRGRYEIKMHKSPKFKRSLPHLQDVDGFTYILMHSGNLVKHTDGCILVGASDGNDRDAWVGNSRVAEKPLVARIKHHLKEKQRVFITVI
jgi:hypothetical protein